MSGQDSRDKTNNPQMKENKFTQSVVFSNDKEQFYYDQCRQMMKDNGFSSLGQFSSDELPNIPENQLMISKKRFLEIIEIAQKDYMEKMFNPFF